MKTQTQTGGEPSIDYVPVIQSLNFSRSDIILNSTPFGIRISMKDFRTDGEPGAPALPHKTIRIALPKGYGFKKLTVLDGRSVLLNHSPEPVACNQERTIGQAEDLPYKNVRRPFVLPDPEKYRAAVKLGKKICRFAGEEMVGLMPVAKIELWPVSFTKEGLLELLEEMLLIIQAVPSDKTIRKEKDNLLRLDPKLIIRRHNQLNDMVMNSELVEHELWKHRKSLKKALERVSVVPEAAIVSRGITAPLHCDYLILTDNNTWNASTIQPVAAIGDMAGKFRELANWKRSRGLRTYIAKVEDIVDGQYGDFKTGARDLQEVIRNFLKWFCGSRGVEFLLLGGDVNIIPVRQAASSAWGQFGFGSLDKKNRIEWKSTYLGMRVDTNDFGQTTQFLTNYDTGKLIPFDSAGTSNTTTAGWYHTTDDTFATRSATVTEWIRVNGPSAQVNARMVWYTDMNLIPTDLYYASLYGAGYSVAGKHDWDHLNNTLYGQHTRSSNFDKVEFHTDVSVGRASVETVAEADAFIAKVLEYEKWSTVPRPESDFDRFRSMLFAAATWGHFFRIEPDPANANPPADNKYRAFGQYSLIHCETLPPDAGDQVICFFDDHYYRRLTYRSGANHTNPGWYYAKSATDLSPSIFSFDFLWSHIEFPIPTPWIAVWDGNTDVLHPMYFAIDYSTLDGSITEQESLREKIQQNYPAITNIERLYTDEADMNPAEVAETWLRHLTEANLRDALNRGPHFVSLTGHGNWPGCAYFSPNLVNSLTNGPKTFILYADSCLTGKMDHNDCVAEVATNYGNGGAVAYIGNTRFSWIGLGASYRELFFMRMRTTRHLGELNDTRLELLTATNDPDREYTIWYCYNTHLFGDPEMPVYRDIYEAKNYYIGNWNTDEIHDCRCQWVDRMSLYHKIHFEKLQDGLNAGYDGCGFCLRQYHTR